MSNEAIEALLAEASRLYNEGEYRKAIKKWEEVLSLDPQNQKAKESINIATLLSDTWSEGGEEPAAEAAAAAPQTAQEIQLEEGLARIRSKLEARDFQGAFADCEALTPAAGENADLKSLTEQARSGLEAEPFIKAALERALKELRAGNFETVEVLCSKILSLDAGNREARNYLVMAQRQTTEVEPEVAAAPVAVAPEPPPAEAAAPVEPAAEPASGNAPAGESAEAAEDPLAALGMDLEADLSPMDLAGPVGEEPVPVPEISGQVADPGAEVPPPASSPQPGEEIDGGAAESVPLAGAPPDAPVTRQGSDIIQDGSVYAGVEGDEAVLDPPAAPGPPPGAPADAVDPAAGMAPEAAPEMPAEVPARRSANPAPRSASRGGGGFLKSVALLLLLAGLGVGGWYLYQIYYTPVNSGSFSEDLRADVAPASGPAAGNQPEEQKNPGPEEAAVEEEPPAPEEPVVVTDEPKMPQDPETRRALAQARYQEGLRLARAGKVRQAMRVLNEALEFDPLLFEAKDLHDELAQQVIEAARFDEDIATVRRAMEDHDYHSALWKLYRMQEAFPSVKGWDYNIASAWYNWGILLLKAGNLQEAIDKFDEVLGIYPDDREAIRQRSIAERYYGRDRDVSYHNYVDALDMRRFKPATPPAR